MLGYSRLLAAFFSYAAAQSGSALNEAVLRLVLPQSAPWLLEQIHGTEKNREELQEAVKALFLLSPVRRRAVARAVSRDISFQCAETPGGFFFTAPSLPKEEREIVKRFFSYFYETAFHRKRGPRIGGRATGAVREEFSRAYFQANQELRHACPICLHPKSDAARECDLEHYFPKGVYSPLSLHPHNLMFICRDCNETYKGMRDALQQGTKPLDKVFRPYQDTVKEHVKITFCRKRNTDHIKLLAAGGTRTEQEKIDRFDEQYQLEERWSADIEQIFEQLRKHCANRNLSREAVRQKLEAKCEELRDLSEFPDRFVESAYLHWLCGPMFDVFYDSL